MQLVGTPTGGCYDFVTTCKLPHGISVLASMALVGIMLFALIMLISTEMGQLLADEDFVSSIDAAVDDAYDALNESGVKLLRATSSGKWTKDELQQWASMLSAVMNQLVLVFLLSVYLMMVTLP